MKHLLFSAAIAACLTACSAGMDKGTVVENGSKARVFVAAYGRPSSTMIASHRWPVAAPDLSDVTWHALPAADSADSSHYSLLEQTSTGTYYVAREGGSTHKMRMSDDLEVFGPITLGSGT